MCLFVYYVFGRIHRSLLQSINEPVRPLSGFFCRDIELFLQRYRKGSFAEIQGTFRKDRTFFAEK